MKFVESEEVNDQIYRIYCLVKEGISDSDIANKFKEGNEINHRLESCEWDSKTIESIRDNFNINPESIKNNSVRLIGEKLDRSIMKHFEDMIEGRFSLPMTFWVFGGLAGFVWAVSIVGILGLFSTDGDTLGLFLSLLMVGYYLAVYVGIWKSTQSYEGNIIWSILAKFTVIITGIPLCLNLVKLLITTY